jgi:hypothetical protein
MLTVAALRSRCGSQSWRGVTIGGVAAASVEPAIKSEAAAVPSTPYRVWGAEFLHFHPKNFF